MRKDHPVKRKVTYVPQALSSVSMQAPTSSVATIILLSTLGASLQAQSSSSWKLSCRDKLPRDLLLELENAC